MWCDNFDMDLFKAVPAAVEYLKPLENIQLETRGHTWKDGTLNHPACWNTDFGLAAFFRFKSASESASKVTANTSGPQPEGFWTDEPLVSCTALEALRDCWAHHYTLVLSTTNDRFYPIWDAQRLYKEFNLLMYHLRGIFPKPEAEVEAARSLVYRTLCSATEALLTLWAK